MARAASRKRISEWLDGPLAMIAAVSVTVLTKFQSASTALTVTVKAVPAVWAVGVPVLPVAVPGAAVSPGTRICSLANGPGLTVWVTTDDVLVMKLPSPLYTAVIECAAAESDEVAKVA